MEAGFYLPVLTATLAGIGGGLVLAGILLAAMLKRRLNDRRGSILVSPGRNFCPIDIRVEPQE